MYDINTLCELYLEHSYRYYILGESVIPDSLFDSYCARILGQIADVPNEYKHIIDEGAMKAGTGFHIRLDQYPEFIKEKCYE